MSDNNSVLKNFNRKLINCRYRVPVTTLVDFLKQGQFGYTAQEDNDVIVTNEFVFADDIASALKHIRAIFKKPIISTKQESVIATASSATKVDSQALSKTLKDEKLWRVSNSGISLEYVHTYVNVDNLAIYENRFICFLLDTLYNAINLKISELNSTLKTLNGEIGGYKQKGISYSSKTYVDFAYNKETFVKLIEPSDVTADVLFSLVRSKQIIESLKETELYIACRKAGSFDGYKVTNTNIFEHEANYHYCYLFFLKYFNKDVEVASYEDMYKSFVEVNLFGAISNLGFVSNENNENITINNTATLKFQNLVFEGNLFNITLNKCDDGIEILVDNKVDNSSAKYLIAIGNQPSNDDSSYTNVFTVVDSESERENVFAVIPTSTSVEETLTSLVKAMLIVVEGSKFIHSRYCPICGSVLISPEDTDLYCANCEGLYHIFNYEGKDVIWIKRLPKSNDGMPEAISKEKLEEAIEEETSFNFPSKSFVQKLQEATEAQQGFYNELKEYILDYKKTRSKISFAYDNFFKGRNSKVKLTFRGKTLVMFVALNFADYENSKYFPKDFSSVKKYADTPMMVKIKSIRGVKFAKELIDIVFEATTKVETPIIAEVPPIVEENTEPALIEEVVETLDPEMPIEETSAFDYVSRSFEDKLSSATEEQQAFYTELKKYVLSYKKSRSKISFAYDNFFLGRKSKVKFTFRGKTLVMFVALNPADYEDTKYFPKDFSDVKKYADTPMMVKIKSTRGVKFAKELIDVAFEGIQKIEE